MWLNISVYRFIYGPRGYTILFWDTVAFDCGIFHSPLSFRFSVRQERTGMVPCLRSSLVEKVYGLAVAIEYLETLLHKVRYMAHFRW